MTIIDALKSLVGYTSTDLDMLFCIVSVVVVMYFLFTMFNILNSLFKR